ncbi:MAG: CHASE2 domain-containing protein [Verrucomicrobia bacterium]|nr:CHASE2 domain-containing protein [Verrucomicrobiota bacterium]
MAIAKRIRTASWIAGSLGFVLVLALGLFVPHLNFHLGKTITRASYDWCFDLALFSRPNIQTSGVVIVYVDEKSHKDLDQPFNRPWDRRIHARLLQRLKQEGARLVLFDILFTDPGPDPAADRALADAIRDHGSVVLAADYAPAGQSFTGGQLTELTTLSLPREPFRRVAAGWGLAQLQPDPDFIVRQHYHGPPLEDYPSLTWQAACVAGLPVTRPRAARLRERWINYYGGPEAVPSVSYSQVLYPDGVPPGFFRGKHVLVGARPISGSFIERRDELRSSYSTWSDRFVFMPAVEIHATMLLNLLRQDWLRRTPPIVEWGISLLVALGFGAGLTRLRPPYALLLSLAGVGTVTLAALALFSACRLWFPWMVVAAVQIPAALSWSVIFRSVEWWVQKRHMECDRRKAEQKIRHQAALLDMAQDAILLQSPDGRIVYWNQSANRLYGWTAAEMASPGLAARLFPPKDSAVAKAREAVLKKGEWIGELTQKTKAGKEIIVDSRWTLVNAEDGVTRDILCINTDVTEQKKIEAQFLRSQRMECIGTLAGGIAHDLNNVLAPILMGAELLRAKPLDPLAGKLLGTIESSALRGRDMVKQVLTFARGQAGEKSVLQLSHLVKEMEKIMRETFPKTVRTRVTLDPGLWPIFADATQLHQVLLNLCVNARDAMPEGGEIHIDAQNTTLDAGAARQLHGATPGDYILVSVTDTGTGMPPEVLEKIFEPFFTTKEVGKGTGLGLSTTLTIVKHHGGVLDVASVPGQGTTFKIHLPADRNVNVTAAPPPDRAKLQGHGEVILAVDDEPAIRDLLKSALAQNGYRPLTAANGAEALDVCADGREPVALVVMDMMMPVMSGMTALKLIRRQHAHIRCLAISGLQQAEKVKAQFPNVEFLAKPFTTGQFLEALQRNLAANRN